MATLRDIITAATFRLYVDSLDYTERTGFHSLWNPARPERHWVVPPDKMPAAVPTLPAIPPNAEGPVQPDFMVEQFRGEFAVPNIRSAPSVKPWIAPQATVKQAGQYVQSPKVISLTAARALRAEINRAIPQTGRRLGDVYEIKNSSFPYTYENETGRIEDFNRLYGAMDSFGRFYDLGEMLASRYRAGAAILAAMFVDGVVRDVELEPSTLAWSDDSNRYYYRLDDRLASTATEPNHDAWRALYENRNITFAQMALDLPPGSSLWAKADSMGGGYTIWVKDGEGAPAVDGQQGGGGTSDPKLIDLLQQQAATLDRLEAAAIRQAETLAELQLAIVALSTKLNQ